MAVPPRFAFISNRPVAKVFAFTFLIFVVLLLRRPETLLRGQFWAEDGTIFFGQQMNLGFLKALTTPYGGYILVISRLVAGALNLLPVRWIPTGFNLAATAIAALCCAAFYWPCFRRIIPSDLLRAGCCLVASAAIPVGSELLGSICNLQWFLSLLMILLIVIRPGPVLRVRDEIALTIAQILIALNSPGSLLYLPFLAWQAIRRRGYQRLRPAATILTLVLQLFIILHSHASIEKPNLNFNSVFLSTLAGGISRSVLAPVIGFPFLTHDNARALLVKLLLGLIFSVMLATWLLICLPQWDRRILLLSAIYIGIGSVVFAMAGRNLAMLFLDFYGIGNATTVRYFFVPTCMFILVVALALELIFKATQKRSASALATLCLLAVFSVGSVQNFESIPLRDLAWPWNARRVEVWRQAIKRHEPVDPLYLPINPDPWMIFLSPDTDVIRSADAP